MPAFWTSIIHSKDFTIFMNKLKWKNKKRRATHLWSSSSLISVISFYLSENVEKNVEIRLICIAIHWNLKSQESLKIRDSHACWRVVNLYLTSVNTTCLRSFGEYFFNWRRSGVLRLFLEVRYKRSPDSLCSSVIFTRMVSPFYYSADAALAILRPL